MYKPHQKSSFTLACLLIIVASLISLSACNGGNKTGNDQTNVQTSPTTNTESPQEGTQSPAATTEGEGGTDPITAGMTGADRPNTDPLELLQSDQLKQELNITQEQSGKIQQITQDFRGKLKQTYDGLNLSGLPPQEQSQKLQEVSGQVQQEVDKARQEIGKVLTPEQVNRFKQITLQIYGFGVLSSDQFTQELKITADQQKQLEDIRQSVVEKMRASWEVPPSDPQKRNEVIEVNRKRMEQILKESNDQAKAVLTPDQQQTLKTLEGEKFNFIPPSPPAS